MEEIWKPILFDNRYLVSNKGRVKSLVYSRERILKPHIHNGYYFVNIKRKLRPVHRLVAFAFIPTNDKSLHIDHIDGNRLNNFVTNLRWCTQQENNKNPITRRNISIALTGKKRTQEQRRRMSEAQQKAKPFLGRHHSQETREKFKHRKPPMKGRIGILNPKSKPVAMLAKDGTCIKVFENSLFAGKAVGVHRESICRCCNGKQKTTGGYSWRYV